MSTPVLWLCEGGCRRAFVLLARIGDVLLCAACWRARGCPAPVPSSAATAFLREQETRERMTAHGGTSRHLVRAGKS